MKTPQRLFITFMAAAFVTAAWGQPKESFQLRPGVVVDGARNQLYVMSPEGSLLALNLTRGQEVWRTKDAAKPLAVAGDVVIGQAETATNRLQIVEIDAEAGKKRVTTERALPPGVTASIDSSPRRSFVASARPRAGAAEIAWEYREQPLRGVPPGTVSAGAPEGDPGAPKGGGVASVGRDAGGSTALRGSFQIRLPGATGAQTIPPSVTAATASVAPTAAGEATKGVPEPKFASVDGRHTMHSKRVANDPVVEKYLWEIYEASSGKKVGSVRAQSLVAPFFVSDNRVIYETGRYVSRVGGELVEEPLQVRAVDISTGKLIWKQPVRDTRPKGPFPP